MDPTEQDRKALQDLIVGNAELEKLEALLDRFNIFEAVGMERQEIRHSKFLAFLLDPKEPHGMGDAFAKRLLQRALMDALDVSAPVTPIELSLWGLGEMSVQREWRRIDIFLLDEREKLAVIIENKVGADEHGDQLDRYYKAVRKEYPDYRLLALYLTPGGDAPSHPDYLPMSYRVVCEILDDLVESRASVIEPDLRVLITHYTEMLRRHIVGDSEIARLSREIYQKHRRAIDLIYKHRPNVQLETTDILHSLVEEESGLGLDISDKGKIRFGVSEWDIPTLLAGNWSESRRILIFEFWNFPPTLELVLFITAGDEEVRRRLFETIHNNSSLLGVIRSWGAWSMIFKRKLFDQRIHEYVTDAEREAEIRKNWTDFLENDLPRIDAALKQEAWIWEPEEPEDSSGSSNRFTWEDGDIAIKRPDEELE